MCHNTPEGSGDDASNLTCLAKFDLPHGRGAAPYGVASFQGFKVCVCVCGGGGEDYSPFLSSTDQDGVDLLTHAGVYLASLCIFLFDL